MPTDMNTEDSPAQQALARLVADQKRPDGVTAWCDKHRPDVELVLRELGTPVLSRAVAIAGPTLYSWADRRHITVAPSPRGQGRASRRERSTDTRSQPKRPAPPAEASADYYRGLCAGLMWAVRELSHRRQEEA